VLPVALFAAVAAARCPTGVLAQRSTFAPVASVLDEAQRQLSRRTVDSQGTIYHLTPKNAPITYLAQLQPDLHAIYRAGVAQCGRATADASWAIHYDVPVASTVFAGGWLFFVDTERGWRFWGEWCTAARAKRNCP
jgi:hypothetical protein